MIYRLRHKFIRICVSSFLLVFLAVFLGALAISDVRTNRSLDRHADLIAENGGRFPSFEMSPPSGEKPPVPQGFNRESPFTTRYFSVLFSNDGSTTVDTRSVTGIDDAEAVSYAKDALEGGRERGWSGDFRYKVYESEQGSGVIFVSGADDISRNRSFMLSLAAVFLACGAVIVVIIVLMSGKAVKPIAESYEKQKQFITDANHELKTPLTLISANVDILESEMGKNDWLSDIRDETYHLNELVGHLVSLARMDEESVKYEKAHMNLSELVSESVSLFESTAAKRSIGINADIQNGVDYFGNAVGIRELVFVLMDNAVKYCDENGEISISLTCDKHVSLRVENSFSDIDNTDFDKLFDRFYRADKSRTYGSGFGIGLSLAKAITEKHGGSICAEKSGEGKIEFSVKLPVSKRKKCF